MIPPIPPKYAAVAAILLVSHTSAFFIGRDHGSQKYYDFKSAVEAEQAQLKADADAARVESERVARDSADGWGAAVDYWRNHPRTVTVRVPATCDSTGLRSVPTAAPGLDAAAVEQGHSSEVDVAECEARLNNAVRDAAQLIHLQNWAVKQHEVKR